MQSEPIKLIQQKTGDWWRDERRNWCAYCGCGLQWDKNRAGRNQHASRDHVIAKSRGGTLTIPCCVSCNRAKKNRSVADFLTSPEFDKIRSENAAKGWSLRDLWLVMAMASVNLAHRHSDEWPDGT